MKSIHPISHGREPLRSLLLVTVSLALVATGCNKAGTPNAGTNAGTTGTTANTAEGLVPLKVAYLGL